MGANAMSVVCDTCGSSNRATAMFCIGCAGRLPGFVPSGPSALEAAAALRPRPDAARRDDGAPQGDASGFVLPSETPAFWLRLGLLGLAMMIGFISWYLYITRTAAEPMQAAPAATASARTTAVALPSAPAAPQEDNIGDKAASPSAPSPRRGPSDASVETVASFYSALAVGNGKSASAFVIPAKRGIGPFNEARMSKFYRSFKEPLLVRSVRKVDRNFVEARYSYRVSKTKCEGTALVETEVVHEQTLIRSIRANC